MYVSARERGGANCVEVARFKSESVAYAYEVQRIAQYSDIQNVAKGGNGSKAQRVVVRKSKDIIEMERIGTRRFAARLLFEKLNAFNLLKSKVDFNQDIRNAFESLKIDALREVAYG